MRTRCSSSGSAGMRQLPSAGGAVPVARSRDDAVRLMDAKTAQRTRVVRIPKLLTSDEVAELLAVFACIDRRCGHVSFGANSDNEVSQRGGRWDTCYIHTAGLFKQTAPALYSKIIEAAFNADLSTWKVLHEEDTRVAASPTRRTDVSVRTAEIHTVSDSGGIPDVNHRDLGSLVTIDVMLSKPETDFSGGQFQTLEADGTMQQ